MKSSTKILIALLFPLVICQVALAWSDTDNANNHSVVALKNCEVVSNQAMTAEQFEAYLGLKQQEQEIHRLELPIQEIEEEIKVYTDELETLTKLVIQDNDGSLHINKKLLKQQDIVAKEFNQFMQLHQQDFDALSKQGSIIGLQAEIFEKSIKTSLESIDYDRIQVLTEDNKHTLSNCDNAIHVMLM
jgi:archaellin